MVPLDQPAISLDMISRFLKGTDLSYGNGKLGSSPQSKAQDCGPVHFNDTMDSIPSNSHTLSDNYLHGSMEKMDRLSNRAKSQKNLRKIGGGN
jgi:hypothetical protein